MKPRTPAYWPTRIMLAAGIAAVGFFAVMLLMAPGTMGGGPRMEENPLILVVFVTMVIGLVWMGRIFRGPRPAAPVALLRPLKRTPSGAPCDGDGC